MEKVQPKLYGGGATSPVSRCSVLFLARCFKTTPLEKIQ